MDATITAALIAALVSWTTLKFQSRQFHEQRRLSWLDMQITQLYGPLAMLAERYTAWIINHGFTMSREHRQVEINGKKITVLPLSVSAELLVHERKFCTEVEQLLRNNFHLAEAHTRFFITRLLIKIQLAELLANQQISMDDYWKTDTRHDKMHACSIGDFLSHVIEMEMKLLNKRRGRDTEEFSMLQWIRRHWSRLKDSRTKPSNVTTDGAPSEEIRIE